MTVVHRLVEGWPLAIIIVGLLASGAWTLAMLWAAIQVLQWALD